MQITANYLRQLRDHTAQISSHVRFIGWMRDELLQTLASANPTSNKSALIGSKLDHMFTDVDWSWSFDNRLLLVYDEVVMPEILVGIHEWLRTKSACLDHVHVLFADQPVRNWWTQWCQLHQQRSFQAEYVPHSTMNLRYPMASVVHARSSDEITKYFSYYAGTWTNHSRNYLLLEMLQYLDHACIDNMAPLLSQQTIVDYLENITYFCAQKDVERIAKIYDQHVVNRRFVGNVPGIKTKNEPLCYDGLQWHTDRQCLATVIRETRDDLPYPDMTEKTMRAFMHQCMAIPISYGSVDHLESLGFQFAHKVFDYSYQSEPDFFLRVQKLKQSIDRLLRDVPPHRLGDVWSQHQHIWQHNAENVLRLMQPDHIVCEIPDNV